MFEADGADVPAGQLGTAGVFRSQRQQQAVPRPDPEQPAARLRPLQKLLDKEFLDHAAIAKENLRESEPFMYLSITPSAEYTSRQASAKVLRGYRRYRRK
jgi:hypothetical protein